MSGNVLVWHKKDNRVFQRTDAKEENQRHVYISSEYNKIGNAAFKNNIKMHTLTLDPSVWEIGEESFYNCTSLRQVNLGAVRSIRKAAFYSCTRIFDIMIPKMAESIGPCAFSCCKRLESVRFENGSVCKKIGREAFMGCASLKELEFPEHLEEIGDSAFLKCKELQYIKIPESVKVIGKWAFHGCGRLRTLEIAHEPENIGEWIVNKSTIIQCKKGGKVEDYCLKNGFKMEYLDFK